MSDMTELNPLAPAPTEVAMAVLGALHLVLVVVVVARLLLGRMTLPHGAWGLVVLIAVPVVGPLLVLTWQRRVDRRRLTSG